MGGQVIAMTSGWGGGGVKIRNGALHLLQIVNLSLGRPGLIPSLRHRAQLVDGAGHVVAALPGMQLLFGSADGVRLLQRGGRAVRARVQRHWAARARRSRGGRAERRVAGVFAAVRYGRRLGARRRRVEERLGQLAHAQRQLERFLAVRLQHRVEQRLQVRLRVLVHPDHQVAVDGRRRAVRPRRLHLDAHLLVLFLLLLQTGHADVFGVRFVRVVDQRPLQVHIKQWLFRPRSLVYRYLLDRLKNYWRQQQ